jgi:hypothetical protein
LRCLSLSGSTGLPRGRFFSSPTEALAAGFIDAFGDALGVTAFGDFEPIFAIQKQVLRREFEKMAALRPVPGPGRWSLSSRKLDLPA